MDTIAVDQFKKRLVDLLVRSRQEMLPRKFEDRHIVLKSIAKMFEQGRDYTEREINAAIEGWLMTVGRNLRVDVFSIRRELVDRKYLMRDRYGACYQVHDGGFGNSLFVSQVRDIDVAALIEAARAEAEARKRAFMKHKKRV